MTKKINYLTISFRKIMILSVFLSVFFIGCQPTSKQTPNSKLTIATSIFPIKSIISSIGKDQVKTISIIPIGANPHTYSPTPSIIKKLQNIDLFVAVHPILDQWATQYIDKKKIFYITNQLSKKQNPHIWLHVKGGKMIGAKILSALKQIKPSKSAFFQKNFHDFSVRLDKLDYKIKLSFEKVKKTPVIQWHPAWNMYAKRYGIKIIGTLEHGHGDQISLHRLKKIIHQAKKENVKTIIVGLRLQNKTVEVLSKELNATILHLDSIGDPKNSEKNTYEKLLWYNTKKFLKSFHSNK